MQKEETLSADEEETFSADENQTDWQSVKIDSQTLENIEISCTDQSFLDKKNKKHRFQPCSLQEMGLIFDKLVKCNIACNSDSLKSKLTDLIEKRLQADIKVIVEGHTFACHLPLLQVSTTYFKSIAGTEDVVIHDKEVTQVGFWKAYNWLVHSDAKLEREHIVEVFLVARYFDMKDLLNQLWYYFDNNKLFSEGTAFQLYLETLPYQTSTLQQLMLSRVRRFFLSAICTVEFMDLPVEKVFDLLSSNGISVNSEMEVLMAALRWLMCDWERRKRHVVKIMSAIRFQLMPSWYLIALKSKQSHAVLREIYAQDAVLAMINAGLSYSVTQHFMDETTPLTERLEPSPQRELIIDERAAHHHVYKCANWKFIDCVLFDAYLQQVINAGPQFCKSLKPWEPANFMSCCKAVDEELANMANTLNEDKNDGAE